MPSRLRLPFYEAQQLEPDVSLRMIIRLSLQANSHAFTQSGHRYRHWHPTSSRCRLSCTVAAQEEVKLVQFKDGNSFSPIINVRIRISKLVCGVRPILLPSSGSLALAV